MIESNPNTEEEMENITKNVYNNYILCVCVCVFYTILMYSRIWRFYPKIYKANLYDFMGANLYTGNNGMQRVKYGRYKFKRSYIVKLIEL